RRGNKIPFRRRIDSSKPTCRQNRCCKNGSDHRFRFLRRPLAESFFQLLKRERIKKKIYGTREEARSDIFDYIEMFYNSKRRHGSSDQMSPTEYENQYYQRLGSV
ncbi:IS3 family transposase, partial [Escherichia coli]